MEYKVGDRIKIKDDLGGHSKDYILNIPCECEILKLKGRECVITKVIKLRDCAYYTVDIHKWWLTEDMFDLVEPAKQFTKDDLKPFYIVELKNKELAMVSIYNNGEMGLVWKNGSILSLSDYRQDLTIEADCNIDYTANDIVKVYGYSDWLYSSNDFSPINRKLLWERVEVNPRVKELENEIDIKNKELKELQIELESLRG